MKIHLFHFNPNAIIRIVWHLINGLKLFKGNVFKLIQHTPDCVNSMSTAYNLLKSDLYQKPKTIIDVGANNSQMIKLLTHGEKGIRIISFEPNKNCHPIGEVYHEVLSDKNRELYFFVPQGDSLWGQVSEKAVNNGKKMKASRLDTFIKKLVELESPILLKIDTEGHELNVLKGVGNYLRKIDSVLIEIDNNERMNENNILKIFQYLNKFGFNKNRVMFALKTGNGIPTYFDTYFRKP